MYFNEDWNNAHTHGIPQTDEATGPRISIAFLLGARAGEPEVGARQRRSSTERSAGEGSPAKSAAPAAPAASVEIGQKIVFEVDVPSAAPGTMESAECGLPGTVESADLSTTSGASSSAGES